MAGRLFGTDGVRGLANLDLTAELALDLSVAAAHVLAGVGAFTGHRPFAVVGRDPRASGEFLEAAVVAGLASAGVDVHRLGVLPTPAVAHLTGVRGADLGVMLSASHNPMPDNGLKFLAAGGNKLADTFEDAIEGRLNEPWDRPTGDRVGRVTDDLAAMPDYIDYLAGTVDVSFDGIRVVLDTANGAASAVGPALLRRLGADVIAIHDQPDGLNINDNCGSTHMGSLVAKVLETGADLGIAVDGDADRCLAVDAAGEVVDGDQLLAILALARKAKGTLPGDTVVATVMSNLGFGKAMESRGVEVRRTKVGDRYLLEEMKSGDFVLGGEQSGHIIMLDHATTGDGLLCAIQVIAEMVASGKGLAELAGVMTRFPQVLVNVEGVDKTRCDSDVDVAAAVALATIELGDTGRVLLRPSGTESLVRVMVEAATLAHAQKVADGLAAVVESSLRL
jgi:phosphoglucosamine mutase